VITGGVTHFFKASPGFFYVFREGVLKPRRFPGSKKVYFLWSEVKPMLKEIEEGDILKRR